MAGTLYTPHVHLMQESPCTPCHSLSGPSTRINHFVRCVHAVCYLQPKFISKKDREAAALARLTSGRQDIVTSQSAMLSALRQQQGGASDSMPPPPSRAGGVEHSRDSRGSSAREYDRGGDRNSRGDRDREPERDRDGRGGGGRDVRDRDRDVRDREPRDRDRDDRGRSGAGGAAGSKG